MRQNPGAPATLEASTCAPATGPDIDRAALFGASPAYRRGLQHGLADHGWSLDLLDHPSDVAPEHHAVLVRLPSPDPDLLPPELTDNEPPVVVLVSDPIAEDHVAFVKAGATAVTDSDDDPADIAALLDAIQHRRVLVPVTTMQRLTAIARSDRDRPVVADTELRWLKALSNGASVRQLATTHGWSDRAMHRALTGLYRRLDVANRAQAVTWAAQHHLLEDHT